MGGDGDESRVQLGRRRAWKACVSLQGFQWAKDEPKGPLCASKHTHANTTHIHAHTPPHHVHTHHVYHPHHPPHTLTMHTHASYAHTLCANHTHTHTQAHHTHHTPTHHIHHTHTMQTPHPHTKHTHHTHIIHTHTPHIYHVHTHTTRSELIWPMAKMATRSTVEAGGCGTGAWHSWGFSWNE